MKQTNLHDNPNATNPVFSWKIAFFIFIQCMWIYQSDPGVSIVEAAILVFSIIPVAIWYCYQIIAKPHEIVENWTDLLLSSFIVYHFLNFILALLNNHSLFQWFQEATLVFPLMNYFVLKKYWKNEYSLTSILVPVFITVLIIGYGNFKHFQSIASNLKYAFEFLRTRNLSYTTTSLICFLFSFVSFLYARTTSSSIKYSIALFASLAIIITSLTRSYWYITIASIIFLFVFSRYSSSKKVKYSLMVFLLLLSIQIASMIFPDKSKLFITFINNRFSGGVSTSYIQKDPSLILRIIESKEIIKQTKNYILTGTGFGPEFEFYDAYEKEATIRVMFNHNGYLFLLNRYGIIGTFFILSAIIFSLLKGLYVIGIKIINKRFATDFDRLLIGLLLMVSLLAISITSSQFECRDGIMGFYLALFLISDSVKKHKAMFLKVNDN